MLISILTTTLGNRDYDTFTNETKSEGIGFGEWDSQKQDDTQRQKVVVQIQAQVRLILDTTLWTAGMSSGWEPYTDFSWVLVNMLFLNCVYVCVCLHVHISTVASKGQKRTTDSLKLELHVVNSCLMGVLGTKPQSSRRAISPAPFFCFRVLRFLFYVCHIV